MEGEFHDNTLQKGKVTFSDGTLWEGEFKNEILHGTGIIKFKDGTTSEGEFENGKLVKGKRCFADGRIQQGGFRENKLHGVGNILIPLNEQRMIQFLGKFEDGIPVFPSPTSNLYGTIEEGDKENGRGLMAIPTENSFILYYGSWKNGQKDGQGTEFYPDGRRVEGNFSRGVKIETFDTQSPENIQGTPSSITSTERGAQAIRDDPYTLRYRGSKDKNNKGRG